MDEELKLIKSKAMAGLLSLHGSPPPPGPMRLHHLLDDGKPQSGAAGCAGTGCVGVVETFKDVRQVFGSNALAAVLHAHSYIVPSTRALTEIWPPVDVCVMVIAAADRILRIDDGVIVGEVA